MFLPRDKIQEYQLSEKQIISSIRKGTLGVKEFGEFTFKDPEDEFILFAPHHTYVQDWIQRKWRDNKRKCAIEMHWESGKTQQVLMLALYMIGLNPRIRLKICSKNNDIAKLRVGALKAMIESSPEYHKIFPAIRPSKMWGENRFRILGFRGSLTDATVQGGGVNCSVIGGRGDGFIFDDPVDAQNSKTPELISSTTRLIKTGWFSRFSANTWALWIGTPWDKKDSMAILTEGWERLSLPVNEEITCMEVIENGEKVGELPLWDYKWGARQIRAYRSEMGEDLFNSGFRLIPMSEKNILFDNFEKIIRWGVDPATLDYEIITGGIDYSSKSRPGTFLGLMGIRSDNHKKVPFSPRYMKKATILPDHIQDCVSRFPQLAAINVEDNAVQDQITDFIREKVTNVAMVDFTTGSNKKDPTRGLPRIAMEINNGMWEYCIPHKKPFDDCPYCQLAREFMNYPNVAQYDGIMGTWFADELLRHMTVMAQIITVA